MTGVLQDREFLRYFVSRVLSGAGSIVTLITLPIIVYRTSGSASLTALVTACEAAPYLLFGLFSGALTDRWNRKKVMVTADILSTLLVVTIPVADLVAEVTVPHVLLVAFVGPTIGVFFDGAVFGALPALVGRNRIAEANSVVWASQSVVEMVVPSLVGVLLAFLHPAWLLGFDALTFAVSAALIAGIVRPTYDASRERPPLTVSQVLRDIREGLDYLVRHPGVRTFTIIGFLQCVAAGGFIALMVVWIDQRLGVGTEGLRFGLVIGAWSVGGLAASLALPFLVRRVAAARIALGALPVAAAVGLVLPFVTSWWLAGVTLALWAVAYQLVVVNSITYRQQVTPDHLLGRVNTAGRMLAWGMGSTGGAFLAGVLVGWLGLVTTLVLLSLVQVVATVVAWTSPLLLDVSGPSTSPPTAARTRRRGQLDGGRMIRARRTGLRVRKIRESALPLARGEVAPRHLARERQRMVDVGVPLVDVTVVRRQGHLVLAGEGGGDGHRIGLVGGDDRPQQVERVAVPEAHAAVNRARHDPGAVRGPADPVGLGGMPGGRCPRHPPARHVDGDDLPGGPGDGDSFAVGGVRSGVGAQVHLSVVQNLSGPGVDDSPGLAGAVRRVVEHHRGAAVGSADGTAVRGDIEAGAARSQRVGVDEAHPALAVPDDQPFAVVDVANRVDVRAFEHPVGAPSSRRSRHPAR